MMKKEPLLFVFLFFIAYLLMAIKTNRRETNKKKWSRPLNSTIKLDTIDETSPTKPEPGAALSAGARPNRIGP